MDKERNKKATKWAKKLGKQKYVEAIFLSGSLAQGHASQEADIDFFIIATPGRIWTARFRVFVQLKAPTGNSPNRTIMLARFCPNHFITADHLEIAEKRRLRRKPIQSQRPSLRSQKICFLLLPKQTNPGSANLEKHSQNNI